MMAGWNLPPGVSASDPHITPPGPGLGRGVKKVLRYVDAVRELDALKRQLAADPAKIEGPKFKKLLDEAVTQHDAALRCLTGGELGRARRLLATPVK